MSVEVLKRQFSSQVQERLFPDNSFYNGAQVDANVAVDSESIEIPQDEDGDAKFVVNPTSFPLETTVETDKKKTYEPDLIATNPQLVRDLDQALLSYDKRAVKARKHVNTLDTQLALRILFAWATTKGAFIKQTTGSDTRAAHAPGATGNRKRVHGDDILYFMSMFNDLNVPNDGKRRLVAPSYMYEDLMKIIEDKKGGLNSKDLVIEKGAIGALYNFQIYLRSETVVYTEASTPVKKAIGAAPATTDNQAIVLFHPDMVRYCKGNVQAYINPNQGQYLGGTMNFALRGGGCISRLSEIGVGALVEDNA